MADRKKESFVTGAAVLTASTIIIKILGAVFKIPLSNIIGTAAMGDFGVAYNIYALLLTLSTAGLPVALSRMVSEADAMGKHNQVKRTFRGARGAFFGLAAGFSGSFRLPLGALRNLEGLLSAFSPLA